MADILKYGQKVQSLPVFFLVTSLIFFMGVLFAIWSPFFTIKHWIQKLVNMCLAQRYLIKNMFGGRQFGSIGMVWHDPAYFHWILWPRKHGIRHQNHHPTSTSSQVIAETRFGGRPSWKMAEKGSQFSVLFLVTWLISLLGVLYAM